MEFVSEKRNIPKKLWLKKLKEQKKLNSQEKKQIIYEYLYNNGFLKIADTFKKETKIIDTKKYEYKHAELKNLILKNILSNNINQTIELLESQIPDYFKENPDLLVELNLLNFIKLVKKGDFLEAINFSRKYLLDFLKSEKIKEDMKKKIKIVLTLLAFKDFNKFPYQNLINQNNVFNVSSRINKKISKNNKKESKLLKINKYIKYFQKNLPISKNFAKISKSAPLNLIESKDNKNDAAHKPAIINHNEQNVNNNNTSLDNINLFGDSSFIDMRLAMDEISELS